MRFQKLEVLEKHFKEAFPEHLSPLYGIVCPNENERKKILFTLAKKLEEISDVKKCFFLKDALEHLNVASLFSGKVGAVLDAIDILTKDEVHLLMQYSQKPYSNSYFIIGAASSKILEEIYKVGKKEMVVLDLSQEKPWEEKKRLQHWVIQTLSFDKKKIATNALEYFLSRFPPDRFLLQQELEKLICYLGDRMEILLEDVQAICFASESPHLFQLARSLVWEENFVPPTLTEIPFLLSLVGQLRSQLELGLKITAFLQRNASFEEITAAFPQVWPKFLKEIVHKTSQKKEQFFIKGLLALYNLEFSLKTSQGKPENLFAITCCTLYEK